MTDAWHKEGREEFLRLALAAGLSVTLYSESDRPADVGSIQSPTTPGRLRGRRQDLVDFAFTKGETVQKWALRLNGRLVSEGTVQPDGKPVTLRPGMRVEIKAELEL